MVRGGIKSKLKKLACKKTAEQLQRFFKTGPGEYGEGDIFYGIKVPVLRDLSKQYKDIEIKEVKSLLKSPYHEERLLALFILTLKFDKGDLKVKEGIYKSYLAHTKYINNWDLVDLSAYKIVGVYLSDKSRKPLYALAKSKSLWERRIAVISTFYFIKNNDFTDILKISRLLISDKEDLMHKAVGWMLREVGKRDLKTEEEFLKKYYKRMPRTMLRYAIEKFPELKRQKYLKGKI
ncbi:MAG: DNA alkylation repair protein [PVC group bacterium]|nr:DNA alkylation repair protein [PVC group bacterium]